MPKDENPYKSPVDEPRPVDEVERRHQEKWWRVYLYLHLAAVILTGLGSWLDSSRQAPGLALLLEPLISVPAAMSCYCTPLVSIWLVCLAATRGNRYVVLAVADGLLSLAHPIVMLPLVQ